MSTQTKAPSVIDALKSALDSAHDRSVCAVKRWTSEQGAEVQELMQQVTEKRKMINATKLYKALNAMSSLPFGQTLFRYHLAGDCACRNN